MDLSPARLEPVFLPRIWGRRNLAPLFAQKKDLPEPIGEAWLTGHDCRFAGGPFAGETLGDAWPKMPAEWAGQNARRDGLFPILAKFIFPADKLSVQVHPDDDYARKHEAAAGGRGKTEMWYVVSASSGAEVRVGLKPEIGREEFRRAITEGTAEECVERVPVRAGDAIFVPAGTVHTIGPGAILCEIQEYSDLTYRVFDYNRLTAEGRPRPLHVEKAMDVIRFGPQLGGKLNPAELKEARASSSVLVECPYFAVIKSVFTGREYQVKAGGQFEILIVLHGRGRIEVPGAQIEYAPAQAWLVPAGIRDCVYVPEKTTTILHAFVPKEPGK